MCDTYSHFIMILNRSATVLLQKAAAIGSLRGLSIFTLYSNTRTLRICESRAWSKSRITSLAGGSIICLQLLTSLSSNCLLFAMTKHLKQLYNTLEALLKSEEQHIRERTVSFQTPFIDQQQQFYLHFLTFSWLPTQPIAYLA